VDNWSATAAARLGKPYTWRTAKKPRHFPDKYSNWG
jgi:hypothetical protein